MICFFTIAYRSGSISADRITDMDRKYERYKNKYTNMTYVHGNLEIMFLEGKQNYNMSFLQTITEVNGYVVIIGVFTDNLHLHNLRLIRGRDLYQSHNGTYALYLSLNYPKGDNPDNVGIQQLGFKNLHEIMSGDVFIGNNIQLCYEHTIIWKDILMGEGARFQHEINKDKVSKTTYDTSHKRGGTGCPPCHEACKSTFTNRLQGTINGSLSNVGHCWGEGPDMCQEFTKVTCAEQCANHCYGDTPQECCHPQCAGGCTGPLDTQCLVCRNFADKNDKTGKTQCVPHCPPEWTYNPDEYKHVPNPNRKYAYGSVCVKNCPENLYLLMGACVKECGAGMEANITSQKCVICDGPCPKSCSVNTDNGNWLDANNIRNLTGCTKITGHISIHQSSFDGDEFNNIPPMDVSELWALKSVREITEYIYVDANLAGFTNMSFLSNLQYVWGHKVSKYSSSLMLYGTSLQSLGLTSLKQLHKGRILIFGNEELCYGVEINWNKLLRGIEPRSDKDNNFRYIVIKNNMNSSECAATNQSCDFRCNATDGCWGEGPNQCLSCEEYNYNGTCVESCAIYPRLFDDGQGNCKLCNEECNSSCNGPGSDQCDNCAHFKDGPFCVRKCPDMKYYDDDKICRMCHPACKGGCKGPSDSYGEDGCNDCHIGLKDVGRETLKCLNPNITTCGTGHYMFDHQGQNCWPCHEECEECTSFGRQFHPTECQKCKNGMLFDEELNEGECVSKCPPKHYVDATGACSKCNETCETCDGPEPSDCIDCNPYRIRIEDTQNPNTDKISKKPHSLHKSPQIDNERNTTVMWIHRGNNTFYCAMECPVHLPEDQTMYQKEDGTSYRYCIAAPIMDTNRGKPNSIVIGSVTGVIFMIILGSIIICFVAYKRKLQKAEQLADLYYGGTAETEPLDPTGALPDMSQMRIIKESEIRRENIIGSGAFGTVYKGFWVPESSDNIKIPVAIKVLSEGTGGAATKELLDESRVMASVTHPHCIKILGVCLTAEMMLITQLMPLGCLLDYVKRHKSRIGSEVLLGWCAQIAKGMGYLESRGIVHRDLAARNVLVQSPTIIKITDFGLAKLLDYNEEEYRSLGGKMPIKWLALECIKTRIYTSRSDVWSYGVTIWELFTGGMRPYENVRAVDVPDMLEKGERLPQPSMCTIDVYMIMIKCWMLDAESRPTFTELANEFSKMARDPGRYLVIKGDRLMRLPSYIGEAKDMVLSMEDVGTERIVEADDYLQPDQSQTSYDPQLPQIAEQPSSDTNVFFRGSDNTLDGNKLGAQRHPSLRYCSTPKQKHPTYTNDIPYFPAVPLPLDEDDYLEPRSRGHPAYLQVKENDSPINTKKASLQSPLLTVEDYLEASPNSSFNNDDEGYLVPNDHSHAPPKKSDTHRDTDEYYMNMEGNTHCNPEYFIDTNSKPNTNQSIPFGLNKQLKSDCNHIDEEGCETYIMSDHNQNISDKVKTGLVLPEYVNGDHRHKLTGSTKV